MMQAETRNTPEQLTSLIAQLIQLLNQFYKTLQLESAALKANSAEETSNLLPTKQQQSTDIAEVTQSLESALQEHNLTLSELFSSDRASKLPPEMQNDIQEIADLSTKCHDLNQANGMSIQILSNINQHVIDLLSGKPKPDVKLYGSSGETEHSKAKNSLGKA